MSTSTGFTVLDVSHEALRCIVGNISAADWDRPTPCSEWTVTQVLQHAVGDQIGFAAFLTGEPGPDENPFAPSGVRPADPAAYTESAVARAAAAWAAVSPDTEEVPVPVPPNKLSARTGAGACALDAAIHAWDIAMATGQPSPLDAETAAELLDVAKQIVEPLRQFGAYAAALTPEPGDDVVADLLRYLGRDPRWQAAG